MKLSRKQGATSQILQVFLQNSASTTGAGVISLTPGSVGLTLYYHKDTDSGTGTAVTLTTMTIGTYKSGGFGEINSTNMPGMYQVCLPDAAYAATAASVAASLRGATNMADLPIEIDLDSQVDITYINGAVLSVTTAQLGINLVNISGVANNTGLAQLGVNVVNYNSQAAQTDANNLPKVDVEDIKGAAVSVTTAQFGVNLVNIAGAAVSTTTAQLGVNLVNISGVAVNSAAAQLGVNTVQINGVSTTAVTAVNANQGTTQPLNFTGTGSSALVKADMVDIAGAAVSTTQAQIGVNIVRILNVTSAGVAGYIGLDWSAINAPTTTQNLSGTTILNVSGNVPGVSGLTVSNLDVPVSSRMATYVQPAGFLAATFPASVGDATAANQVTINNNVLSRVATAALPPNFTLLSISGAGLVSTADFITQLTESYRANGAPPTPAQALCEILAQLGEAGIVGVTKTINKFDHSTVAETFTLDSSSAPTSITRAT